MHCGLFQRLESSRHLVLIAKHKKLLDVPLAHFGLVCSLASHTLLIPGGKKLCPVGSLTSSDFLWERKKITFSPLLLLPLQCMARGTSGLRGACALPLVGEATGTGPAPANPPSSVGTPARAPRSKPSSATSPSAQVGTVTDLKPPLLQVPPAQFPSHGSSRSVAASREILNYPKEDPEERIHWRSNPELLSLSSEMSQVQVCPVWSLAEDTLQGLDLAATCVSKATLSFSPLNGLFCLTGFVVLELINSFTCLCINSI